MSETAASRTSRLLALLPWLVAHPDVSVDDAAREFNVSRKQLLADLATLTFTGPDQGGGGLVDIDYEGDTIRVYDTQGIDRPLRLTTSEAAALLVALEVLEQVPGPHDRAALTRAKEALTNAVGQAAGLVHVRVQGAGRPEVVAAVTEAVAAGRAVEIEYAGAARDVVTTRVIDPVRLLNTDGYTYLDGYCRRAKGARLFRLDRIVAARVLDEPSDPVLVNDDSELFTDVAAELVLDLPLASRWVVERYPTTAVDERPDGSLLARLPLADTEWAIRLGLALAGRGVVVAPSHVAEQVRRRAGATLALYS